MPILDVDRAKSVIVIKRSMGHGYAGIDNELYLDPKAAMYFADARKGPRRTCHRRQNPRRRVNDGPGHLATSGGTFGPEISEREGES
jgi:hypothetical protein